MSHFKSRDYVRGFGDVKQLAGTLSLDKDKLFLLPYKLIKKWYWLMERSGEVKQLYPCILSQDVRYVH